MSEPAKPVSRQGSGGTMDHLDEMTCLLYAERQLDRARAQAVSAHAEECSHCRTLLRALERESRLLTRAMLEEDESLPARLAQYQERARKSFHWIWGLVFGLATTGVYALYTYLIEPWQDRLQEAGFGGTSLLSLLIFQGAFWKGWQSMVTLLEILATLTVAASAVVIFRKRLRRGSSSALALVLAGLCAALALPATALATEFRKSDTVEIAKDETIKGDIFITCARARIDGTVDGDVFFFGQSIDINGHIKGDAIVFGQSVRINGQVDGNVRAFANNATITGTVERNVLTFNEVANLDSAGKVNGSITGFAQSMGIDGKVGRDVLAFDDQTIISGSIDGDVRAKGRRMSIASSATVGGKFRFEGDQPASVARGAKLASPPEFTKAEHRSRYREGHYYVWRVIWTAAFILFGLVLFLLMPNFAAETTAAGERFAAPVGLGVLVFFGVPIAAILACVTVVGLPLGVLTIGLWLLGVFTAEIIVGTVVGSWIMGKATDTWGLIGRMALGFVIVRVVYTPIEQIHIYGFLVACGIFIWGMGSISLALYNRLAPAASGPGSIVPSTPLPPHTTIGRVQPA